MRPSRMTVISSEIANTSSRRCETKTIAHCALSSRAMTSNSRSTSLGLKDAVGSSKMMRLALSASAFAISTSWRCAAERSRASASSETACSWPRSARISLARRRIVGRDSRPGRPRSGRKMFSRTERSGARLVSCMTMAMPASSASRGLRTSRGCAAIEDLAAVATDMTGNDARERRLARAVRAEQRMGDARPQGEIRADERARLREALRDRARLQKRCRRVCHRFSSGARPALTRRPPSLSLAVRWRTRSL